MPKLKRADGVEVHWEERGEGPTVFFAHSLLADDADSLRGPAHGSRY